MKSLLLSTLLLYSLLSTAVYASQTANVVTFFIQQQANQWLNVVDSGNYAKSWQQAGNVFKTQISQQKWRQALTQVRKPLGDITHRELLNAQRTSKLPTLSDGDYVIMQYKANFEHKKQAVETLTLTKQNDTWHVIGYFIK